MAHKKVILKRYWEKPESKCPKRFCSQDGAAYQLRSLDVKPVQPAQKTPQLPTAEAPEVPTAIQQDQTTYQVERRTSRKAVTLDRITAEGSTGDYNIFLSEPQSLMLPLLKSELERQNGIKFHLNVDICFRNSKDDSKQNFNFISNAVRLQHTDNVEEALLKICSGLAKKIDEYTERGSGWIVDHLDFIDVHTNQYRPLRGSSFIRTPWTLAKKKAVLNVLNTDDKCFMWSVLAYLYPQGRQNHANRIDNYRQFEDELDFTGIPFPVTLDSISCFEEQNSLAINVVGFEKELYPLRSTKNRKDPQNVINLLLLTNGSRQHYCLITDLNRLLHDQTKHQHRKYFCPFCLMHYSSQKCLDQHSAQCQTGNARVEMPQQTHLKFTQFKKQLWAPLLIVGDFECFNKPVDTCEGDPSKSSTTIKTIHIPNSYGVVSVHHCGCHSPSFGNFTLHRGEDPVTHFLQTVLKIAEEYQRVIDKCKPLQMTALDTAKFHLATDCHICHKALNVDRVRDHCHTCGQFRGAAHSKCNLEYKTQRDVPVLFHNLQRYDGHLIMQKLGDFANEHNLPIWCIPKTMERYLTFSIRFPWTLSSGKKSSFNIKFIDSVQFLQSSLADQVTMLAETGDSKFAAMKQYFPDVELRKLLLRKNAYPYEWLSDWGKFNETNLPPPEAFYNTMEMKGIDQATYEHSEKVWQVARCRHFGDYNDLYLQCDVLQLADVFQNFRVACKNNYDLDPTHYVSIPGFAWDACLRLTGTELELLKDPDDYHFFEMGMRGGISVISGRYARANNPYMGEQYNPEEPKSYILYLDANNLYGWAMTQKLPISGFKWLDDNTLKFLTPEFIVTTTDNASKSRVYEVDLEIPVEHHDYFNDYPMAPETIEISEDMLSPYSRRLREQLAGSTASMKKLTPNLRDKQRYIVHERNLKFYLQHGIRLTHIHRAMEFNQEPWLKPYIEFNTAKRTVATTKFDQDFFKLMNNAVFGKSMENVRKYQEVKLVTNQKQLDKLVANPRYKHNTILTESLTAVSMQREKVTLDKPIYSGFAILDTSKLLMYGFHYDFVKNKYGDSAKLLFTDTDSLCYHIATEDVFKDMLNDRDKWFDCSAYPQDHPLFDLKNKKVIGKMKDEFPEMLTEFVGLRSKMYSCDGLNGGKKVAKGVNKKFIDKQLHHASYKAALNGGTVQKARFHTIQSINHQLYSMEQVKTSLSAYDDKRYILPDGVNTLAHGHYSIANVF